MAIIHNQISGLTKAEQKLLNYIEKNLLHIEELTIRNLAEQAEDWRKNSAIQILLSLN